MCNYGWNFYLNIFFCKYSLKQTFCDIVSVFSDGFMIQIHVKMKETDSLFLENQIEWTWLEARLAETQVQLSVLNYLLQVFQLPDKYQSFAVIE